MTTLTAAPIRRRLPLPLTPKPTIAPPALALAQHCLLGRLGELLRGSQLLREEIRAWSPVGLPLLGRVRLERRLGRLEQELRGLGDEIASLN